MTAPKMDPEVREEIIRRLLDGAPVSRIAQNMRLDPGKVRAIRNEQRIPARRPGGDLPAQSKPVRWDDTDEQDGDPVEARPHRIPVGLWCIERPNQAQWMALVKAAHGVEREALRLAMTWVLGLSLNATDDEIATALVAERRTAEDLAGLYVKARGYGR